MATKQKISPEDATILKTYGTSPATKRFARDLMLEGKTLEEVIKTCQNIAKKEQEIKNTWYRAMLREMSDQRFDGTTYELQKLLEDKAVVTEKILSRANRHLKELTALGKPKSREQLVHRSQRASDNGERIGYATVFPHFQSARCGRVRQQRQQFLSTICRLSSICRHSG